MASDSSASSLRAFSLIPLSTVSSPYNRYYGAGASALENKVSLYYAENGRRITLKCVDAPVPAKTWHTVRVEFSGYRIVVMLDGKTYIDVEDAQIGGVGRVGMWTQADSVVAFDDLLSEPALRQRVDIFARRRRKRRALALHPLGDRHELPAFGDGHGKLHLENSHP